MGELTDAFAGDEPPVPPRRGRSEHPTGWEPGVEFNGKRLEVTSRPTFDGVEWEAEFAARGLDHSQWQLDGAVQFRYWDAAVGGGEVRQMRYFKAQFLPATSSAYDEADVHRMCEDIRQHGPVANPANTDGPDCMVVCIADWQIGKGDGDGIEGTIERVLCSLEKVSRHIERVKPKSLLVASLGDLVEGCGNNWYAMQDFSLQLDRRDQLKVLRRLLTKCLTEWVPLVPTTVVAACAGNHGENRRDGKAFTSFGDNDDLAVWEQVREVIDANPEYGQRVGWVIPQGDEIVASVEAGGAIVGLVHGHQAGNGATPQKKLWEWWKGQMSGRQPIGDADILLSGHFHHLSVNEPTVGRVHIQAPAMDGGSTWYRHSTGMDSQPGMLTFTIDGGRWNRLVVL